MSLKPWFFLLEGLNSFATVYCFYYFYFFMQARHGFGNRANLALAALIGAVCMISAWGGGKFAQRFGYFTALKLGWGVMLAAMLVGLALESAPGHICVVSFAAAGMCFTWPTLEALVSEGETRAGLQQMVGVYNVVWAGVAAVANFSGGAFLTQFGLKSLFYVPATIHLTLLGLTFWLEAQTARQTARPQAAAPASGAADGGPSLHPAADAPGPCADRMPPALRSVAPMPAAKPIAPATARKFLWMAWLANPFAYVAINTLVALIPGLTRRLGLSTMLAGFCCSVWCFARFGAFLSLWLWDGWHYRFRWLLVAYLGLIAAFTALLTIPSLLVLVLAQLLFGAAVGLTYYSSLFYAMDVGETKGEHGGLHEAAIGLGNFVGPAVGAAAAWFLPQYASSGPLAVTALLVLGLAGLLGIWRCRLGPASEIRPAGPEAPDEFK